MIEANSIFLDVVLPNATTWFYLSLVLAAALFLRLSWKFSLQNWDLAMLFLAAPAILFLRDAQEHRLNAQEQVHYHQMQVLTQTAGDALQAPSPAAIQGVSCSAVAALARIQQLYDRADRNVWRGYLWLHLCAAYFLVRCFIDLGLVRRPAFHSNLNLGGLACLGVPLLLVLSLKLLLPALDPHPPLHPPPVRFEGMTTVVLRTAEEVQQRVAPQMEMAQAVTIGVLGIGFQAMAVAGLLVVGSWHFQRPQAGVAAALLFLLLPYAAYQAKDLTHVFPAALLATLLACHRWPTVTAVLLAVGAVTVYFPVLLVPLWASYYLGKSMWRFLAAFTLALAVLAVAMWWTDALGGLLETTLGLPDWRAWDLRAHPTGEGLWTGLELHYAYRLPLFIGYLAVLAATALWPSPKNLGHLIALNGALVVGVQFWLGNAGGTYVLWYLPCLILLLVRPTLTDVTALPIDPHRDWLCRLRRLLGGWLRRRKPEAVEAKA